MNDIEWLYNKIICILFLIRLLLCSNKYTIKCVSIYTVNKENELKFKQQNIIKTESMLDIFFLPEIIGKL